MLICLPTSFKLFGGSIEFLAVQAASSSIPATAVPWLGMPHTTREKHNSGKTLLSESVQSQRQTDLRQQHDALTWGDLPVYFTKHFILLVLSAH